MTALPVDVTRCRPIVVDSHCRNCKRWADHPEHVSHSVTRVVLTTNSRDEACAYAPVSLIKGARP